MTSIDLRRSYNSSGESIQELFGRPGEGFCVPEYQREYTWEEENITRLFEDLILGIDELVKEGDDHAATFLGTAIFTDIADKKETVRAGDEKAQPTAVRVVVDGQQRIATIAVLSIQLTVLLKSLEGQLPTGPAYDTLKNHSEDVRQTLEDLYSFKLRRGAQPLTKPKIIRADEDRWEFQGDGSSYRSPVALYIATYIKTQDEGIAFESLKSVNGTRVAGNISLIRDLLRAVAIAHTPDSQFHSVFPQVSAITTASVLEYVLGSYDADVAFVVNQSETDEESPDFAAIAVYQLSLFAYYLLERCGINLLQPSRQDWGFDMFQALNSTGTPLTAIETFRPDVMQTTRQAGLEWQQSEAKLLLEEIEELFERTTSNEQKNRRTNELLNASRLCFDGQKLGNRFSTQHRWLRDVYVRTLSSSDDRNRFLEVLARVSSFLSAAWYVDQGSESGLTQPIANHQEADLAPMLIQYLKDANSGLSAPVLAMYHGQLREGEYADDFIQAVKAAAAFFTLWRSARSTSGLDDIYRKFFRGSNQPLRVAEHNWRQGFGRITADEIRNYFAEVLNGAGILDKAQWVDQSERFLKYNEIVTVCRFALFLAAHDQIPDDAATGLTTQGRKGVCDLLNLRKWRAKDYKSLEHVAPQSPEQGHTWDDKIYSRSQVHDVGNLVLLPSDINSFVDRKSWAVKYLHYSHIGKRGQNEVHHVEELARSRGIVLSDRALKRLENIEFACAIEPVVAIGIDGVWDSDFIARRSEQIRSIVWEKLRSWL